MQTQTLKGFFPCGYQDVLEVASFVMFDYRKILSRNAGLFVMSLNLFSDIAPVLFQCADVFLARRPFCACKVPRRLVQIGSLLHIKHWAYIPSFQY